MHLFLMILLNLSLISLGIGALSFAPWVPMRKRDLERVVRLAEAKSGEIFYDLGCGDGRTVLAIAKQSGVKAIGIELAFPMYAVCKIRQWLSRSKAQFLWRNLFHTDISNADVIYVFGMPKKLADRFRKKLEQECKPGTRVLSYVFTIEGWTPEVVDKPTEISATLYRYRIS